MNHPLIGQKFIVLVKNYWLSCFDLLKSRFSFDAANRWNYFDIEKRWSDIMLEILSKFIRINWSIKMHRFRIICGACKTSSTKLRINELNGNKQKSCIFLNISYYIFRCKLCHFVANKGSEKGNIKYCNQSKQMNKCYIWQWYYNRK